MISKGQMINNRYQIIKTIGEGGMANVYLAQDTILDRQVAVKVLRGDLADDEKFVRRFQREAISASSLSHPNIVEMYDVGEDDGRYYIVMEFINGKTLKSLVKKRGALTLPEVTDIMLQLTNAVACAHDSYIIHRDIKPQNVMILEDGRVKITDFGIAMALNSNELTQTNSVMGSVHYLPPEQANGSGATIKSDIYSLGILMYELLVGKIPFKGENAVEIAIKQMKESIPSVIKQNPDIPQSIENIILKACAKNPKNRYENVREMYEDLKNALTEDGLNQNRLVYKYPESDLEETKAMPNLSRLEKEPENEVKTKKKNKALWITGGICAGLIALVCLLVIFYPKLTEVPDVVIPDVANLSVVDAEQILKNIGLGVESEIEYRESDEVEPGRVVGTNPQNGRTVKKDTKVTIIVAIESGKVTVEDYAGKDYKTVKANLENAGINVLTEGRKISKEDQENIKENTIVEQSAEAGSKLESGDTIVLYYAVYSIEYPDFVGEMWSVSEIQEFCDDNDIILRIETITTTEYQEGSVIYQSRTGEITSGATLIIRVVAHPQDSDNITG